MSLATHRRPDTSNPSDGSRTITVHDSQPREEDSGSGAGPSNTEPIGSLHLRGGEAHGRRVMWTDDTVDNEGAGRKKSKICCIYRKPRAFDESSSEESSSDEDSGPEDDGSARPASGNGNGHRNSRSHRHHLHQHGEDGTCPADGSRSVNELEDRPEPNAYERAPGKGKGKTD